MYKILVMNTSHLLDNPADLKELIAKRDVIIADNAEYISQLEEQVRLLKALRYHAQSEKAKSCQGEDQYYLFDEAELVVLQSEIDEDCSEEAEVAAHVRKKKGRRPISPDYPALTLSTTSRKRKRPAPAVVP